MTFVRKYISFICEPTSSNGYTDFWKIDNYLLNIFFLNVQNFNLFDFTPNFRKLKTCFCHLYVLYSRHLEKLMFELPRDPDQQKEEMLKLTEKEHYRPIREDELERINFYLNKVLTMQDIF